MHGLELVVLDVAAGTAMESQSGLQMNRPRIYGALAGPARGRIGAIVMHPTSNFMGHYLLEPFARRGMGLLALNSRYAGNDSVLVMERVIQDLGAGVAFMREHFERVFLIGNSGGAALMSFYQAQAEHLTITHTPAGDPVAIAPGDLPAADGIALMAGHIGRSRLLLNWLDASVTDENDPLGRDASLDIYDPANGPPFAPQFVARVRAAQRVRSERITARAKARLALLRALRDGPRDEPFLVYRTYADPRFVDLALDANDRKAGGNRGDDPRQMNYGVNNLGRYTSLSAWLSQWSLESRADGPTNLARTQVPVLHLEYTADAAVFPSDIREWSQAIGSHGRPQREEFHRIEKGNHYLKGQPELVERVADLSFDWALRLAPV
ncbi:MAG: alpha/beta hydrolase [Betaproteobacteria bacterium]|nr:alpha/beta hydrolase [Betaproteobacteria bacterium]